VFTIADSSGADKLFSLEERNRAAEILKAVRRPFANSSALPEQTAAALRALAHQAAHIEPDVEVPTMSACWNSIWAICNLYEFYGEVIAHVGIENNEFVAITLKGSEYNDAEGKILVGPRGTFAYVLTRGEQRRPGYGGTNHRLVFFPDEDARAAFEEFGWTPREEHQSSME
jgi:hypothetical protein